MHSRTPHEPASGQLVDDGGWRVATREPVDDLPQYSSCCFTLSCMSRPFLTRQAIADGMTRRELARLLRDGTLRRVLRGVVVDSSRPDDLALRAEAIALVRPPGTVVVRRSAAWLCGIDAFPPGSCVEAEPIELAVRPESTPPRWPGCKGYRAPLPDSDLVLRSGLVTTSDARTALDLGRYLPRLHAVAAVDALLHRGLVAQSELAARTADLAGQRNVHHLRRVVADADAGAQTPGESWTRVRLLDARLPRPRTQIPVVLPGQVLRWLDMGYEEYLLAIEYDGEENHTDESDRAHDEVRREEISQLGWDFVIARKGEVLRDEPQFPATVAEKLLERGWRPQPHILEGLLRQIHAAGTRRGLILPYGRA
jgi:very-short-patch-repair endonuclease